MLVVAEFVNQCDLAAVRVIGDLEDNGKVSGDLFKCMDQLSVLDDWQWVANLMQMPNIGATALRLREVTTSVVRERWWSWVLQHPELSDQHIHHSRSVFFSLHCLL